MQEKYIIFRFFLIVFPPFCEPFNPRFTCIPSDPSSATNIGRFPFSPKFRKFRLEIKSNGPFRFGPTGIFGTTAPLKVVHFDWSGHFGRSDRIWHNCYPQYHSCILLTRTITKRAVACVGYVQPEYTVPLGTWNFGNLKLEFLLNGNAHG